MPFVTDRQANGGAAGMEERTERPKDTKPKKEIYA